MLNSALSLIVLFLLLTCQGCVGRQFYHPDHTTYDTPDRHGLRYEEVTFHSKDGTRLTGWFIPSVGSSKGTIIHFHGNAQNMTSHFTFVSWLPKEGFNLFLFDYRGYGQSAGTPDRRGVYDDSVAALEYVAMRSDVDRNRLLVLGQSLGGANAVAAVGANSFPGIRAVVIESAFASYRSIVQDKIGQISLLSFLKRPLSYLLTGNSYSPDAVVERIAPVPLLLIYGTDDPVVPFEHGKRLYAKARQPKELWTITGGGHTGAFSVPGSPYRQRLVQFFDRALAGRGTP